MDAYLTLIASHGNRRFELDVKLNLDDDYVRIGAPVHEVLQVQPHLLNAHVVTVSNLYGVPLFQLHCHRKGAASWVAHSSAQPRQTIAIQLHDHNSSFALRMDTTDGWHFEAEMQQPVADRMVCMMAATVASLQQTGARWAVAEPAGAYA